jgi:hypothetical protein
LFKFFASAFIASILIIPVFVFLELVGVDLSSLGLSLIYLGFFTATYLSIGRVARFLLKKFYNISLVPLDDEYSWFDEEIYSEASDEENLFMVWSMVRAIYSKLSSNTEKEVVLVVHAEGAPISSYPEEWMLEDLGEEPSEEAGAEAFLADGGVIAVYLELEYFRKLLAIVSRGEGELGIVESMSEARALYEVSLAITRALYGSLQREMELYLAYKAIVKLSKDSLRIKPKQLEDLIPADKQKRSLIIQQLKEEA